MIWQDNLTLISLLYHIYKVSHSSISHWFRYYDGDDDDDDDWCFTTTAVHMVG